MSLTIFPEIINRFRLINDSNNICSKLLIMYTRHTIREAGELVTRLSVQND